MAAKKKSSSTRDLKPKAVKASKAGSVRGGKVALQDLHFVQKNDKASP